MLKPQDIAIVLHIVNLGPSNWTQQQVAYELDMSQSEISQALKRLIKSHLMTSVSNTHSPIPDLTAIEEFIIHGFRYAFPAEIGTLSRGVPTAYAAEIMKDKIDKGLDAPPVWPHAEGNTRGYELKPLYKSLPNAILKFNHRKLYEILALLDTLRHGRARERKIAIELIKEYFKRAKNAKQSSTEFQPASPGG